MNVFSDVHIIGCMSYSFQVTINNTDIVPDTMEQDPSWKANSCSDGQQIPRLLWNPKFHYPIRTATGPYPESDESNSHFHALFL
jgi:hypothetical protein